MPAWLKVKILEFLDFEYHKVLTKVLSISFLSLVLRLIITLCRSAFLQFLLKVSRSNLILIII